VHSDQWDAIGLLLDQGWPGEFPPEAQGAYRVLLEGFDPEQILAAIRVLVRRGGRFRPSASELAGELQSDPGRPTWGEAFRLLFASRGLLTVRPEAFAIERAEERHPLLAAFIRQEGYDRLRTLAVHDPDWGERTRRELEQAWKSLGERADHRLASGMALDEVGRPRRGELARPNLQVLPQGDTA
jgi:hypothetical protein